MVGIIGVSICLSAMGQVHAQNLPDGGSILKEQEKLGEQEPQLKDVPIDAVEGAQMDGPIIEVKRFVFTGNSVLSDGEMQKVAADYVRREVHFSEINVMLGRIAELYQEKGYLARVYLPEQDISDGVVQVAVVEARFGRIRVEDEDGVGRLNRDLLRSYVEVGQDDSSSLDLSALSRSALLLNDLPGVSTRLVLTAGDRVGFTDIVVVPQTSSPFAGRISVDNYGSRSTGELRGTVVGQAQNLMGRGELFQAIGLLSEGNEYGAFNFRMPVGVHGLKVGLGTSMLDYELVGDFEPLDANGEAFTVDVNVSYPLIRRSDAMLDVSARIGRRDYTNRQLGMTVSDKVVDAYRFEAQGRFEDSWMGGGQNFFSADITFGDLDLSGNPLYALLDSLSNETAGSYRTFELSLGRLQRVTDKSFLNFKIDAQWANKNLDSSETFVLGGPNGVRAYPVLEGNGDNGWLASIEYRYYVTNDLSLSAFYDHGRASKKATLLLDSSSATLKGAGLGLNWKPKPDVNFSASVSHRLGDNPLRNPLTGNDSDGSHHRWRFWVQASKSF